VARRDRESGLSRRSSAQVRRAAAEEREKVIHTVTAAFAGDPAWRWLMPDSYDRLAPAFVGALFDSRYASGDVWVSDDVASVAMWDAPRIQREQERPADDVWSHYGSLAGERAGARLAAYHQAIAAVSPDEPHWYLGVLATLPSRQSEGLATAAIAPVVEEADRDGLACCLETSTERNGRFYEHRGFFAVSELALPAPAPRTWWMRRAPAPRQREA
jgi:GNAT superfamily N-acetyltransferase